MKRKPLIPREAATRDIESAIDYYVGEGAERAAMAFVDAVEQAFRHISRFPSAGSPRVAHELDLPGLRHWPVNGYPYLVFYQDVAHHVDVWRVLHEERDNSGLDTRTRISRR